MVDGFDSPAERLQAIAQEVEDYITARAGSELPEKEGSPVEFPDTLYWLQRVEKWGLLVDGGLLNQPYYFMLDLDMASLGRSRAYERQRANVALARVETPPATPGPVEKKSLADFIDLGDLRTQSPGG